MKDIVSTTDKEIKENVLREVSYGIIKKSKLKLQQIFKCLTIQDAAEILRILNPSQRKQIIKLIASELDLRMLSFLDEPIRSQLAYYIKYSLNNPKSSLIHVNREELIQRRVFETSKAILERNSNKLRQIFNHTQSSDAATILEFLSHRNRVEVIRLLGTTFEPEILTFLDSTICEKLLESIDDKKLVQFLSQLDESNIIEMIHNIDDNRQKKIINSISKLLEKDAIKSIKKSLYYPENTAGRIMSKAASFESSLTIGNVYQKFFKMENIPNENQNIYIHEDATDEMGRFRPLGEITILELCRLYNNKKTRNDQIGKHISEIPYFLYTNTKLDEVGFLFKKYCMMEMPVLNPKNNRFLGSIRSNKAIDILEEASEVEVLRLVGLQESDFHEDIYHTIFTRIKWYGIASTATILSSGVINGFSTFIQKNIILASVMQIVPAIGGNSASQVMTITVRALSNREIASSNLLRTIIKEVIAGLGSGLIIGYSMALFIYAINRNIKVSIILWFSITINTIWAGFVGTAIPIYLHKKGGDPALASVFLNITTDMVGYLVLLGLAKVII